MKKAFTLIELLIVMGIIGVFTAMTMSFGGDRIQQLRYQSTKELFANYFENARSSVLSSNYFYQQKFEKFNLTLNSGANTLDMEYFFDGETSTKLSEKFDEDMQITNIQKIGDEKTEAPLESVTISMLPYELACEFNTTNTGGILSFQLAIKDYINDNNPEKGRYCFTVDSNNCKLTAKNCKKLTTEAFTTKYNHADK